MKTSGKRVGYIPANAIDFLRFMSRVLEYVQLKLGFWLHIPAEALNKMWDVFQEYKNVVETTEKTPTSSQLRERKRKQTSSEKQLRQFVNQYLRYDPVVTDFDRDEMGIPNRDTIRTNHTVVNEGVEFSVEPIAIRELLVKFWVRDADNMAKPKGYDGAVIIWAVLDTPPDSFDQLTNHVLASRTPFKLLFDIKESGKTVYIALAWQNNRGIKGMWTNIRPAIVP